MTRRKSIRSRLLRPARAAAGRVGRACVVAGTVCWRAAARRLRRPGPTVIVDVRRRQARRLRCEVGRAARTYARALGAELPPRLLIVVQRVAYEGRQLNGLLQAFDAPDGSRRYVLHLALSINGRQVSEDELLAALRHQLARVLEDAVGKPALSVPLDLEVPRVRAETSEFVPPERKAGPLTLRLSLEDGLVLVRWDDREDEAGYTVQGSVKYGPPCELIEQSVWKSEELEFEEELAADSVEFAIPKPAERLSLTLEMVFEVTAMDTQGAPLVADSLAFTGDPICP